MKIREVRYRNENDISMTVRYDVLLVNSTNKERKCFHIDMKLEPNEPKNVIRRMRKEAGRLLADCLVHYSDDRVEVIKMGLPIDCIGACYIGLTGHDIDKARSRKKANELINKVMFHKEPV